MEVVIGMWACVNDSNITTYTQNFDMCAPGFTPVTYDLVQGLGLPYPTQQESSDSSGVVSGAAHIWRHQLHLNRSKTTGRLLSSTIMAICILPIFPWLLLSGGGMV